MELPLDITVTLSLSNPLFSADRIPIPYAQNFDLNATPHNLNVLGNPHKITSVVDFKKDIPGEIWHSGLLMSRGYFTIDKIDKRLITLNFKGIEFNENFRKPMSIRKFNKIILGEVKYVPGVRPGTVRADTTACLNAYNTLLQSANETTTPNVVAAPMHIKGEQPVYPGDNVISAQDPSAYNPSVHTGFYYDHSTFINTYRPYEMGFEHDKYMLGYRRMSKVIPSFRVGYLLVHVLGDGIKSFGDENIFNRDFANLMLICNSAPTYQIDNDSPVWRNEKDIISINLSDYLPDIAANEFITESLKLTCATLFIRGAEFNIELNRDVLNAKCDIDWSNKIFDNFSLSTKSAEVYEFSLNIDENNKVPDGVEFITVDTIQQMVTSLDKMVSEHLDKMLYYKVKSTEQIYKAEPNSLLSDETKVHWSCVLMSQGVKTEILESEKNSFDMNIQGGIVGTTVTEYVGHDGAYIPDFSAQGFTNHIRYFCPEIEADPTSRKRSTQLIFGLYHGMQNTPTTSAGKTFRYPLISHTNILPNGDKLNGVSLDTEYLATNYHKEFKKWVEKDKRLVNGKIIMSPLDVRNLDLRKKIHLLGFDFFINQIDIPLKLRSIMPAETELIEA